MALLLLGALDAISWVQSNRDLDQHFWNFGAAETDPRTVRLEVNAHQWAWAGRYAGPDGSFNTGDDAVTLDDLRVPVDTPILIELTSTDVIHDFYLPNFRLKQDVIPGRVTRVLFTATETGEFEIACSSTADCNHYKMRGLLRVLSQEDYRRWLQLASANSQPRTIPRTAPPTGDGIGREEFGRLMRARASSAASFSRPTTRTWRGSSSGPDSDFCCWPDASRC